MVFKYFIIGFVQGITEFLPVSSSGHIVLFSEVFNINCDIILLSVVVHIATLFSVIFCMRKKIWQIVKRPLNDTNFKLVIATIPTILIVALFKSLINKLYGINFVIYGFLITGIMLLVADIMKPKYTICDKKTALYMGVMQSIAILPGISRSGSTMAVGMMKGLTKESACEFSFLMSIPIILGSAIYECLNIANTNISVHILPLVIAFVTAFMFGIVSIKLMLKVVKSNKLCVFSIYLIAISIVSLIFFFLR